MNFSFTSKLLLCVLVIFFAMSCSNSKTTTSNTTTTTPTSIFDKEKIMVLLKPDAKAKALVAEFKAFGLKNQGQTSRSENRFIFSFDKTSITPDTLLQKLKILVWSWKRTSLK